MLINMQYVHIPLDMYLPMPHLGISLGSSLPFHITMSLTSSLMEAELAGARFVARSPGFRKRHILHARKLIMEPRNGGLEDDVPFQRGDFQVPCWFSGGYIYMLHSAPFAHVVLDFGFFLFVLQTTFFEDAEGYFAVFNLAAWHRRKRGAGMFVGLRHLGYLSFVPQYC